MSVCEWKCCWPFSSSAPHASTSTSDVAGSSNEAGHGSGSSVSAVSSKAPQSDDPTTLMEKGTKSIEQAKDENKTTGDGKASGGGIGRRGRGDVHLWEG